MELVLLDFGLDWDPPPVSSSDFSGLERERLSSACHITVFWKYATCLPSQVRRERGVLHQDGSLLTHS